MNFVIAIKKLSVVLGLAVISAASLQPSTLAKVVKYQVESGTTTFLGFHSEYTGILEPFLKLKSVEGFVPGEFGSPFGLKVIPPSSNSSGSNLTFDYDTSNGSLSNFQGEIKYAGKFIYDVAPGMNLPNPFEIGDLSFSFNDLSFKNNASLKNLSTFSFSTASPTFLDGNTLRKDGLLVVSQEWREALLKAGLSRVPSRVGFVALKANVVPVPTSKVFEPGNFWGIWLTGGAIIAVSKVRRSKQIIAKTLKAK
ncbi:MAG: hypothetical protein KME64_19845 [Scytonematopsis contorta HA4267-MV1]|jgi:hypothetical protein|nr:hypothetical protein [Scytonematopsis contorta HA4267-MV1]